MWFILLLVVCLSFGREVKVLLNDGSVKVVEEKSLYLLKSSTVYVERPKRLFLKDPVLRGSSIGIHLSGQMSLSMPVQSGQVMSFFDLNANPSFSGSCAQSSNTLNCNQGELLISSSSPNGRLILISQTHRLGLLPSSYYLGTNASLSGRTGRAVLVAVVDTGIDLCHPEFEDRTIFFYDATTGQELDQSAIRQARQRGECDKDFGGHGTAVAGVLAGKNGIAPGASIVAVKVADSDGSITDATVMRALEYLSQKKTQLGRPMVVNISLGSNYGPGDGDSLLERKIEQLSGPGLVVVAAAGNEGDKRVRAVVPPQSSAEVQVRLTGGIPIEVWYGGNSTYRVELCNDFSLCKSSLPNSPPFGSLTCVLDMEHRSYPLNGKRFVNIDHNCSGEYTLRLSLVSGSPSRIDLFGGLDANEFLSYTVSDSMGGYLYTVGQPASGRKVLAVGAFTLRALSVSSRAFNDLGRLAYFSSRGPTVDDRTKPDLSAGGYVVYTAQEGGGYSYEAGTSFSAPAVAGLVALLLEASPNLTVEGVKNLLCSQALIDPAVGNVPNNFFGCGKANLAALEGGTEGSGGSGGGCSTGSSQYNFTIFILTTLILVRKLVSRSYVYRNTH